MTHSGVVPDVAEPERRDESGQALVLWTGAVLYALSFLLYAVTPVSPGQTGASANPLRGFVCAIYALVMPLMTLSVNASAPKLGPILLVGTVAAFVGGCVNPLFLMTFFNVLRDRQRTVETLRIVLCVMIACCGIAFYALELYPREGFLVWVLGMLLVVSSAEVGAAAAVDRS